MCNWDLGYALVCAIESTFAIRILRQAFAPQLVGYDDDLLKKILKPTQYK
jgi:hypothetical protein